MCFHKYTQCFKLPVFKLQQSFLTTADFDEWWADYQRQKISSDIYIQHMIDAFPILSGEMSPPLPSTDAHDATIQTTNADEVPKKVTNIFSPFFSLQKAKNKHSFYLLLGSKKGFHQLNQPLANLQKGKGHHRL